MTFLFLILPLVLRSSYSAVLCLLYCSSMCCVMYLYLYSSWHLCGHVLIFCYDIEHTNKIKIKSHIFCNRRFCHNYRDVRVPAASSIFELVQKMGSAGCFLDKKCIRQNTLWTEKGLQSWNQIRAFTSQILDTINSTGTGFGKNRMESD
jgi:hypothetical protein